MRDVLASQLVETVNRHHQQDNLEEVGTGEITKLAAAITKLAEATFELANAKREDASLEPNYAAQVTKEKLRAIKHLVCKTSPILFSHILIPFCYSRYFPSILNINLRY